VTAREAAGLRAAQQIGSIRPSSSEQLAVAWGWHCGRLRSAMRFERFGTVRNPGTARTTQPDLWQ
jgi:hypothetical protein